MGRLAGESRVPWGTGCRRGKLASPSPGETEARGVLTSGLGRGETEDILAGWQADARAGATGAGMESVDSPWGDMVRTVTSWQACSSCSWDTSTSTLPAVGEATSIIYREDRKQGRKTKISRCEVRMSGCWHLISVLHGLPTSMLLTSVLRSARRLHTSTRPGR